MSDALVSPAVGGAMWAAAAGLTAAAARRVERDADDGRVPLMGVLGAFVFAAQMVNFAIPGTGSSGHLGGGLLLAVLLGPAAGFLVMASVVVVQALFFADGGLLALGCNAVNVGALTCLVAFPLVWRPLAGPRPGPGRLATASVVAGAVGALLGALAVVLESGLSGISTLPFASFAALMLPVHLAIGVVEGLFTALLLAVVRRARPEIAVPVLAAPGRSLRPLAISLVVAAAVAGGLLSRLASAQPDGLEWAVQRAGGGREPAAPEGGIQGALAGLQRTTAVLPGYDFRPPADGRPLPGAAGPGTSLSGLLGAAVVLALAGGAGLGLRRLRRRAANR